MSVKG